MPGLTVIEVDRATYEKSLIGVGLPLWGNPAATQFYGECFYLLAYRGKSIEAAWIVPIMRAENGKLLARRPWRLLPYAGPIVLAEEGLARRAAIGGLYLWLCSKVNAVSLPLAPDNLDISILQNYGALVEWRHTHVLGNGWLTFPKLSRISNHLRHANVNLELRVSTKPREFLYRKAISSENDLGLEKRVAFAESQLAAGSAFYIEAYFKDGLVGQIFVLTDEHINYAVHTWSTRGEVRGIATALVDAAAKASLLRGPFSRLDLEGSVLPGVDEFFYGFQGTITPYGYMLWSDDGKFISKDLGAEIFPPERRLRG